MIKHKLQFFFIFLLTLLFISCQETKNNYPSIAEPEVDLYFAKQFPFKEAGISAKYKAIEEALRHDKQNTRSEGNWQVQGPGNIGARVNCIAVNPKDSSNLFIGFSDGGLWRSTDNAQTWEPVFDNQTELAIGSIAFHPSDKNTVFVGTGDPNISGYPKIGNGIFKSENLGNTWTYMGLAEAKIVSKIAVLSSNSSVIYASAMGSPFEKNNDRGLYKSIDKGTTWQQVLYINDSTGVSDFVINPNNENIIYAITWNRIRTNKKSLVSGPDAKVYQSIDAGLSWKVLEGGLPTGSFSRLSIDISASNPNVLCVLFTNANDFNVEGIYRTSDGGENWISLNLEEQTGFDPYMLGGFGWYFGKIKINPKNENDLFVLGVDIYRGDVSQETWSLAAPPWYTYEVHADKHDLVFANDQMFLATDGGMYRADVSDNLMWEDAENIVTTQFYRTAYNPHFPELYFGGAQDNGTSSGNEFFINDWERIIGGDGFQPAFHPTDDQIMYAEIQRGDIRVSLDGGLSFQDATENLSGSRHWDMQYFISSHNPDVLYTGTDKIFKSTSGAIPFWEEISPLLVDPESDAFIHQITCLDQSEIDEKILYAGTSDGLAWVSTNGGENWNKITTGLPMRYVSSIKASPLIKNAVYITFTGYKDNDFTPKVFRSNDLGSTWEAISGNLPNLAINDILIYPDKNDNILFAATDGGIYYTIDHAETWNRLGTNMPYVPTYDMAFNHTNNQLVAATFARGIQSFDLKQVGIGIDTKTKEFAQAKLLWKASPTVTFDVVNVSNETTENQILVLYDMNGIEILKINLIEQSKIDLSIYPSGVYILSSGIESKKIIKL